MSEIVIKIENNHQKNIQVFIRDVSKKEGNYFLKSEIIRLENEIIVSKIVFEIVQGQAYEELCKINCPRMTIPEIMQNKIVQG